MQAKIKPRTILRVALAAVAVSLCLCAAGYYNLLPVKAYSAEDFGIATLRSDVDFNGNGVDDYSDLLFGARKDAENHPRYDGAYYDGGYPPDDVGVCTDVIWRAFRHAGYDLREMVNSDVLLRSEAYPSIDVPDKNIDFRRVGNLRIFFEEYALSLTADPAEIDEWQPGDIVFFGGDGHIGIVSDKRSGSGQPYIIHNGGQPVREESYLKRGVVTGHYRFDATKVDPSALIAWAE